MNEIKRNGKKWFYWFVLGVAIITFYKLLDNFGDIMESVKGFLSVLRPFFIGILIAYILYMPSRKIEGLFRKTKSKFVKRKARTLSIATAYIIFILLAIIIFNFVFPVLIESLTELVSNIQMYADLTIQKYQALPDDSILKSDVVTDLVKNVQNIDIGQYVNMDRIAEYAKGAIGFVTSIIDVFVAIIVSVYILSERGRILKFFERLTRAIFGEKRYAKIDKYFNNTNEIFLGFLGSQLIDAVIVGILTTIAMSIMGIKYAPLLGFIIGLFNIIPYVGAIIAVVIAAIVTLITGGISQAIWMLVVVIVLQQIDANVINPKIVGNTLKISPLLVMFAITVGGAYFGMMGMFLAVPVSAVLKILVEDYIAFKNEE
ncbi:MAG: AI-2E family transporter [Clostridia bacterium]|nr:AI-2E family transporter [Clostridia bacterium]